MREYKITRVTKRGDGCYLKRWHGERRYGRPRRLRYRQTTRPKIYAERTTACQAVGQALWVVKRATSATTTPSQRMSKKSTSPQQQHRDFLDLSMTANGGESGVGRIAIVGPAEEGASPGETSLWCVHYQQAGVPSHITISNCGRVWCLFLAGGTTGT